MCNVPPRFVCEKCNEELAALPVQSLTMYPDYQTVRIKPCKKCLDRALGDGRSSMDDEISESYEDGYNEGFENGKKFKERKEAAVGPPSWLAKAWHEDMNEE